LKRCPCGAWIKRAKRAQLIDNKELKRIKQAHDKVHVIANDILSDIEKVNVMGHEMT
jgi:hypothetical protein